MMNRQLIEEIVLEVLKKLNTISSSKQSLFVVNATNVSKKIIDQLASHWDIKNISAIPEDNSPNIEHVLFLNATQDLLVKGALGIRDTFESELLSHFILKGATIDVIPIEQLNWMVDRTQKPPSNLAYVKNLLKYKEILEGYGIQLVTIEQFISANSKSKNNGIDVSRREINYNNTLLTQADVEQCMHNHIMISNTTIVTPLARDRAREMGKTISVVD